MQYDRMHNAYYNTLCTSNALNNTSMCILTIATSLLATDSHWRISAAEHHQAIIGNIDSKIHSMMSSISWTQSQIHGSMSVLDLKSL
jgi:hypothetical protein